MAYSGFMNPVLAVLLAGVLADGITVSGGVILLIVIVVLLWWLITRGRRG